jgi:hypothetical protein
MSFNFSTLSRGERRKRMVEVLSLGRGKESISFYEF